jgi:hypothetical protein
MFDPELKQSKRAALVGNELDSALASALDNFSDIRADFVWSDDEVRTESQVIDALTRTLELWSEIAPYILDDPSEV